MQQSSMTDKIQKQQQMFVRLNAIERDLSKYQRDGSSRSFKDMKLR